LGDESEDVYMVSIDSPKITERSFATALKLLDENPTGLKFGELRAKLKEKDENFKPNTIGGCIWNLDARFPEDVYKPSKGLFRLTKYKKIEEAEAPVTPPKVAKGLVKEEDFYKPFAEWLMNEVEDVTEAIALGKNKFKDRWGTPDVIGKRESRRSDIIKGPIEIVSAEIKTDTAQLVTAFGQACAYKLFSHKSCVLKGGARFPQRQDPQAGFR